MPRHDSHHRPCITLGPTSPLLQHQPCKGLPGTFILAPAQPLRSGWTYEDVDQDQLRRVSALLVEPLLHTGLGGIRLKPTAVAVQAVMNLWETFGDLSGDRCLGRRGPAVNFACSEEKKKAFLLEFRHLQPILTYSVFAQSKGFVLPAETEGRPTQQ